MRLKERLERFRKDQAIEAEQRRIDLERTRKDRKLRAEIRERGA